MNYGMWLKGLLFTILLVSYGSAEIETVDCRHTGKNSEGFSEADCSNMNLHIDVLPRLPTDIQILDLSQNPNLVMPKNFLDKYADTLVRLNLSGNYNPNRPRYVRSNDPLLMAFSKLINLEELDYSFADLRNDFRWVLPKNLVKYNIDNNSYSIIDIRWCKKLEQLSVNYNKLQYLPKFGLPLPPLTKISAKGNPFNNLTLLDLAPFCELSTLELEFPKGSYLAKEEGFCDCMLIKNWTIEEKIKGCENLNCTESKTNATNQPSCSNDLLETARKIRKTCPLLLSREAKQLTKILKSLFFLIVLGILVAAWVLFIMRSFHLRERFHIYHGTRNKIDDEEEEEEVVRITSASPRSTTRKTYNVKYYKTKPKI